MSEEDIIDAIEVVDTDASGSIEFDEFEQWWEGDFGLELRDRHEATMGVTQIDEVDFVERWEASQRALAATHMRQAFEKVDADGSGALLLLTVFVDFCCRGSSV